MLLRRGNFHDGEYYIDEMRGDDPVALHIARADSPLEALKKVTAGPFVIRTSESNWFRVVDERQNQVFSYALAEVSRPR